MNIKEQIEKTLGLPVATSNLDICEYQCNSAFAMAKEHKTSPATFVAPPYFKGELKSPFDFAKCIAEEFNRMGDDLAVATAHPSGFVNFVLSNEALKIVADEILKSKKLPLAKQQARTILLDYLGANVAKELHIGHLRPPIIGEALRRTFNAFGHKTISHAHLGDWGLQMGLVIAQLSDEGYIEGDKFVKEINLDVFNVLYPRASKRSKEEPEFRSHAEDITVKLQRLEQPYYDLWKQIRAVSVTKIEENYRALGCTWDAMNGESNAEPYIKEAINILKSKGAYESQGCLILDVKEDSDTAPMPPVILQKPNGGDLYATTDIATILYRVKSFKPDEIIYVTDFRQELHFEQVFRTVKKGGIAPAITKFTLVPHGTMNGSDGKAFKTRSGDTVKLDDVIKLVTDAASKKMRKSNSVDAQKIGVAALKFADLSNGVRKDYVFDIDKFTSFEGKTGPYLLYTVARINSVLLKTPAIGTNALNPSPASRVLPLQKGEELEKSISCSVRDIIVACVKLCDAFSVAVENYSLNAIVDAVWNLANKFNLLYANETIQGNDANIKAAELTRTALFVALDALAIEPVDEM